MILNLMRKPYYVGTDAKEIGTIQGKILVDAWNTRESSYR